MKTKAKRLIAIVAGGNSSEYEVSLRSAKGLYSFFDHERYEVYIVVMKDLDWHVELGAGVTTPVDRNDFSFEQGGERRRFDYAYITVHGTPGENGILQGYFDLLHIPYSTSDVLVEALTFDKYALNNYLRSFGVTVADSILLIKGHEHEVSPEEIIERIGLPCFVKPVADGSSFGISKVKTVEQLQPALEKAFKQNNKIMIERFMDGTEVTVACYKTREKTVVLPITEIVTDNEFFDYDAKYNGEVDEITPARISPELTSALQAETSRIYDLLLCNGIIRIDYIVTKNADNSDCINLLEINTTPGMTAASLVPQMVAVSDTDMATVLSDIIENQF